MADGLSTALSRNLSRALREKRFDDARELLERLRQAEPASVVTRCLELELAFESGALDEAAALAPKVVELYPESARARFLAGRIAAKQRRWKRAVEHFEESHKLAPNWRSSWWMAKALTQLGDFERAEPILVELTPKFPCCGRDLAWLFERKGQIDLATDALDAYLEQYDDEYARGWRRRLDALQLDPGEIVRELDELRELGEEVDDELVPTYVESLLKEARGAEARAFMSERTERLPDRVVIQVAWKCYHMRMYDLAMSMFVRAFDHSAHKANFRSALEKAARSCGREDELVALYRSRAEEKPFLWGRIRALEARRAAE